MPGFHLCENQFIRIVTKKGMPPTVNFNLAKQFLQDKTRTI